MNRDLERDGRAGFGGPIDPRSEEGFQRYTGRENLNIRDEGLRPTVSDFLARCHGVSDELEAALHLLEERIEGPPPAAGADGKAPPPMPQGSAPMVERLLVRQEAILLRLHNIMGRL